jgi:hypothetical protein
MDKMPFFVLPYPFFSVAQRLVRRLRQPRLLSECGDNFRTAHFRGRHAAEAGLQKEPTDALYLREHTLARVPVPACGTTTSGRTAL